LYPFSAVELMKWSCRQYPARGLFDLRLGQLVHRQGLYILIEYQLIALFVLIDRNLYLPHKFPYLIHHTPTTL
ncbi:MAG: hypothetical protein K2M80_06125, partial [Muribaculaceae bacterium]|nr:hypothetical protein [Muribaculaceae bacterium]